MVPKLTEKLHQRIKEVMVAEGLWNDGLEIELPRGWNSYSDLILFPAQSFVHDNWRKCGNKLWGEVAQIFKVTRLARVGGPVSQGIRKPNVEILLPGDGSTMVSKTENGVKYSWDLVKCMYSPGNTVEKLRIAKLNCVDQVVVDMFAGIGYFTLPYLVKAKAKMVYAIDLNPDAVEALEHNLKLNKCQDRCVIIQGDNRQVTPVGVADHVNLGYVPSCEESYEAACKALRPDVGGILRVHGNCDLKKTKEDAMSHRQWANDVQHKIMSILMSLGHSWTTKIVSLCKVKSFAPRVNHLVVDIKCSPTFGAEEKSGSNI